VRGAVGLRVVLAAAALAAAAVLLWWRHFPPGLATVAALAIGVLTFSTVGTAARLRGLWRR
jgi:hypothetical protein